MTITIAWGWIPFLVVLFGFWIAIRCTQTLGVAVLVIIFSLIAAISFTAGKLFG